MSNYAVLSDIHGNLQALEAVHNDMKKISLKGIILLGDLIDYGMQSNEVVDYLKDVILTDTPAICSIWGNHEKEIIEDSFSGFSSKRGEESARNTARHLREDIKNYLKNNLDNAGSNEFTLEGKRCLAVHGSKEDSYWKSITPDNLRGDYGEYDLVFSGHSHFSHCFSWLYATEDSVRRNKKAVVFINPGSVGQPRNHNPLAQYSILDVDSMTVQMRAVQYDVEKAMSFFDGSVDDFYRERLKYGV